MPRGRRRAVPNRGDRLGGMHTNPINQQSLTNPQNAVELNNVANEGSNPAHASCDVASNVPNAIISTPTISQASNDPLDTTNNGGRHDIMVVNGMLEPSSKCSRVITKVFKQKVDTEGYTWKTISQATKDFYFEEFRKHCMWDSSMEAQVKTAWVIKASQRYSDFLRDIRKSEQKPEYMSEDDWRHWKTAWENPDYKMKREKNSKNRRSIAGPSSHTGGSISYGEYGKRLASSLGRIPTPHELFLYTHTKKHDGQTFIDEKSKSLNDKVLSLRDTFQTNSGSGNDNSPPIDEVSLYCEAVGGGKKGRMYGIGPQVSFYYCDGGARKSTASSSETQNQEKLQNELATMHNRLEMQDNVIVGLKRTIEMLCSHIGMPPPHQSQNTCNSQPDESESARNGDDGDDHRLT